MKTFIEELDGLQTVLDYQKRALNLIMDSWRKPAETKTYHCAECDFETTDKQRAEQHKEGECLKEYE